MKAILVIDIADDIAEAYEDFTVDYDLRGTPKDDQKVNESIRYVEDCPLKPMPKKEIVPERKIGGMTMNYLELAEARGRNKVINELLGETE